MQTMRVFETTDKTVARVRLQFRQSDTPEKKSKFESIIHPGESTPGYIQAVKTIFYGTRLTSA
jgi:hypothetical protein